MKINKIIAFASAVQLMAAGAVLSSSAVTATAAAAPEITVSAMKQASDTATFKMDKSVNGDQITLTFTATNAGSLDLAGYSLKIVNADGLTFVSAEAGSKFNGKVEVGKNTNEVAFRSNGAKGVNLADGDVIIKLTFKGNANADPGVTSLDAVNSNGKDITDKITISGNEPFMLGDVTLDGKVDAADATDILKAYSNLSTGLSSGFNSTQKKAAEVIADGKIDASDATTILQYYSFLSTGGKGTLTEFMKTQS